MNEIFVEWFDGTTNLVKFTDSIFFLTENNKIRKNKKKLSEQLLMKTTPKISFCSTSFLFSLSWPGSKSLHSQAHQRAGTKSALK